MQQRNRRLSGESSIAVCRPCRDALEQSKHATYAGDPIEGSYEMHLASTGIGKAGIESAGDKRSHQTFGAAYAALCQCSVGGPFQPATRPAVWIRSSHHLMVERIECGVRPVLFPERGDFRLGHRAPNHTRESPSSIAPQTLSRIVSLQQTSDPPSSRDPDAEIRFLRVKMTEICRSRPNRDLQWQAEFQVNLSQCAKSLSVRKLLNTLVYFHELFSIPFCTGQTRSLTANDAEKKIDKHCRRD
jgi:hypothetical protein